MTREELQRVLRLPYDPARWTELLRELLPSTEVFAKPQSLTFTTEDVTSAAQLARIPLVDGRFVAVIEVRVSGHVDLQRNRAGLRNLVARFIDQQQAHAVLALFSGSGVDYRFSFVARTTEIGADGQLSRSETAPRRYTYLVGPGQSCRTPAERLDSLRVHRRGAGLDDLVNAFKVEPLFKEFFSDYRRVFNIVKDLVRPTLNDDDALQLFTQRLFNRLMFLAFIERKGWLRFKDWSDRYLGALWDDHTFKRRSSPPGVASPATPPNFYRDRLVPLFFEGLNQPGRPADAIDARFGSVPYLNGGLFEYAEDGTDALPALIVPDDAVAAILDSEDGLFARYNFTVAESTPLEIDLAVDPEMLGKVFEELVTGRHDQGSYYTPKPIVSFMCREALVEYLTERCLRERRESLESFVHDHQADGLKNAEAILAALRTVTVCDPACGSGAYLLGMLHELLDLRSCLFKVKKLDALTAHDRKLEIIESNLYGVDLDPFAINIARLRLWLSLAVEFEGAAPPPLPNLDFKIEQGNALAAPAPAALELHTRDVRAYQAKKRAYLTAHGAEKSALRAEIEQLKKDIASWLPRVDNAFNWAVEFAEVFLPSHASASVAGELNLGDQLAPADEAGGFDIIVTNPPYVRQELIKDQKPNLKRHFGSIYNGTADLYIYFYARAHELLRQGGVAAFVSPNKWLRAGYGEGLRRHLLDDQAFRLVLDFGDLPVFSSATAYPCIFLWQKRARAELPTDWAMVRDLERCYAEGVRAHFVSLRVSVPATQFGEGKPRLATPANADLRQRMERSGQRLGDLCSGQILNGVKSGLNDAFVIDAAERATLISSDPGCASLIKPFLEGDDVRRYEIERRERFLIYVRWDTAISRYPGIEARLRRFESQLRKRDGVKAGGLCPWFALSRPRPEVESAFEANKIIYPEIGLTARFCMDESGFTLNNKVFFLPTADWFILAVLNSRPAWSWIVETLSPLRGGYWEFRAQYIENLPIPNASASERAAIGDLARRVQLVHGRRRARVEQFLRDIGVAPETSTSRNPLEQPWLLSATEFAKRAKRQPLKVYEAARDETAALTEQITKAEAEIDAQVGPLYGLDAEDQRWAAQATPSAQPADKQTLFFRVLAGLKERQAYFRYEDIQRVAHDEELALKDSSLSVYLTAAVKQGLVHDAGRGWYSRLSEPVHLDEKQSAKLVRAVEKAFPLLEFSCWNTVQLNPWMHHLLAQPIAILYADGDALDSVGEKLRSLGWEVSVNPTPTEAPKTVRPGPKAVVLRPAISKQPEGERHQAPIEKVLVDLVAETPKLALMDDSEAQDVVAGVLSRQLVSVAALQSYAERRGVTLRALEAIALAPLPMGGGGGR